MGSMGSKIFTVRNSSCGKVMFSQASVILYTGGVAKGGACVVGDVHGRGQAWQWGMHGGRSCVVGGVRDRRDGHCSGW